MKVSAGTPLLLARASRMIAAMSLISLATTICSASRISGTYVSHGPNFAEMLQLTQTDNGQISGVLSGVELKPEGNITSEQGSVTGVVDADQLTLSVRSGPLSFLGGTTIAGTVKGSAIQLQIIDSKGNVTSDVFIRCTPTDFKAYVDQLKSEGEGLALSKRLTDGAQHFRQTVQSAEEWIANAELHAQRIPRAKGHYQEIEDKMQSLVAQERAAPNLVPRLQIALMVNQGDIAGGQFDNDVNHTWDFSIEGAGSGLNSEFAKWDGNCGTSGDLQRRGATAQAADAWESACTQALAERVKFAPIYKRMVEHRDELKTFQATAQAHRKALVDAANGMNYAQER